MFSLVAIASSAHAKPGKPVGIQAWTSGAQTYIRARPGANVPPVAKVDRHTPLYVWGKYRGWYRVETHDHIFGWVLNPYLSSPDFAKVQPMTQDKARLASKRTDNQVMYGSPAVLQAHLARYGSVGARKGLEKQGVYLATAPKADKKSVMPLLAKPSSGSPRASMPLAATPKTRIATTPRVREKIPGSNEGTSPVPMAEKVPLSPIGNIAPLPESATTPDTSRDLSSDKIAGASRSLAPSARQFALAVSGASAPQPYYQLPSHMAAPVALAPAAPTIAIAPKAPVKVTVAKKPVAKKVVAQKPAKKRTASWRDQRREKLRANMGMSRTVVPATVIAPVSPAELLKAREDYLNARKARLNSPIPPVSPQSPVVGLAPLPSSSGPLGGPAAPVLPSDNILSPTPPALLPQSFTDRVKSAAEKFLEVDGDSSPLQPLFADPQVIAMAKLKPSTVAQLLPKPQAAKPSMILAARGGSPRGGSPRDRAFNRSGSPRDRFGAGMANQALSYRGMPYIRGASSPSRGFDCSGLVFYLLRQRGYNPPRTAAGYRNWGTNVPRGQWKAGDLVLFANTYKRGISHIGVYIGEGKFVHAATSGTGVRVSSLSERYYAGKYYGARRAK